MRGFQFFPAKPNIDFMGFRFIGFVLSAVLTVLAIVLVMTKGLNFGIDFRGGILIEIRTQGPADLADLRAKVGKLDLGQVDLQGFGTPTDVLIQVQEQAGGEVAQQRAVEKVRQALGPNIQYRRVEFVGPKVGSELIRDGMIATVLTLASIMAYIWFRFEWQFGVCGVLTLLHDVITTIGMFALLQYEFNLTTVAAVLTIAGYSLNDTVVVYDRIRENIRKFKKMPFLELLNRSVNETLSRTIMTSMTTMLALLALYFFGGEVISGFSFAMIWGVIVGTYSTFIISTPLLLYLNVRRASAEDKEEGAPAGQPG
jgi:preprotein translocase subunit SecF